MLKRILQCFQLVSGLKINLAKSMVVGVGCSFEEVQLLASALHCKVVKMPFLYLGLSIRTKLKAKVVWDPVVLCFEQNLSLWKRSYLSLGAA